MQAHWVLKGTPEAPGAEFLTARFRKEEALRAETIRIYWSWFSHGTWQAPENPRWAFSPAYQPLYKLYVVREVGLSSDPPDKDPAVELIRLLVPSLTHALAPATD